MKIHFIVPVYKDFNLLKLSVPEIKRFYPDSTVSVMSDGNDDPNIKQFCDDNDLRYYLFSRSHVNETPGAFYRNMIKIYDDTKSDIIIKADPDSRVCGNIKLTPDLQNSVFGTFFESTLDRKIYNGSNLLNIIRPRFIQNGIFGIGSSVLDTFKATKFFDDDVHLRERLNFFLSKGLGRPEIYALSTELLMAIACNDLKIPLHNHEDFYSIIYMKPLQRYFYNEVISNEEATSNLKKFKFIHPIYE
jgi:hypothetical protein